MEETEKLLIPKDCLFYGLRKTMTREQTNYVNSILRNTVTFVNAKAGTGKTTLAYASLYYLLEQGEIDKIYYIFSPVEEGQMGYRPGTQREKEAEYRHPLNDAILKIHGNKVQPEQAIDDKKGWIEAKSHVFLRGRTLERVGIILDESQNYTRPEIKKTLTRLTDSCHSVVIGHDGQIDLPNANMSGFKDAISHFEDVSDDHPVGICELTHNFRGWVSTHADKMGEEVNERKVRKISEAWAEHRA